MLRLDTGRPRLLLWPLMMTLCRSISGSTTSQTAYFTVPRLLAGAGNGCLSSVLQLFLRGRLSQKRLQFSLMLDQAYNQLQHR